MKTLINYRAITIQREAQTLFSGIDFSVREGEFVYLIGRVGCGKSTMLKSIYAEVPVEGGRAEVFDYDVRRLRPGHIPALRRRLGIIFQDFQLLTDRTVEQNLSFVLRATGWKKQADIDNRIREVLQQVGMENKGYRMPNTLSGGEQQRIVIARALLNRPAVILADEPTGNLDPETGRNIVQLLHDISRQGTSVVMSTHNLALIPDFPGTVYRIEAQQMLDVTDQFYRPEGEEPPTEGAEPPRSGETPAGTQTDVPPGPDGSSSDAARSTPPAAEPEAPCRSEAPDGTQPPSAGPAEPCTPRSSADATPPLPAQGASEPPVPGSPAVAPEFDPPSQATLDEPQEEP